MSLWFWLSTAGLIVGILAVGLAPFVVSGRIAERERNDMNPVPTGGDDERT